MNTITQKIVHTVKDLQSEGTKQIEQTNKQKPEVELREVNY